jgi:sulfur carrier protein
MQLVVNGQSEEVDRIATVHELVRLKNLPELQVVLELNGKLIRRDEWGETLVQAGDTIEILRFVGGG